MVNEDFFGGTLNIFQDISDYIEIRKNEDEKGERR